MSDMRINFVCGTCAAAWLSFSSIAFAAPITLNITATIQTVEGSYIGTLADGQSMSGSFVYDTDEANASSANTTGSTEPGHEFSSFYDFAGAAYYVSVSGAGYSFNSTAPVGVVVNNDLEIGVDDTGGVIPPGTYDWIEILGSTASDVSGPNTPGNGEEWTLAFFAEDANWFTDGSVIPDNLPLNYTALLVGVDLDANGDEVGLVIATVDPISAVPVPGAVWLLGSGLMALVGAARHKRQGA